MSLLLHRSSPLPCLMSAQYQGPGPGVPRADQLNRLSCTRCKDRKVRCSRVMPRCDKCRAQGAECIYPLRVKRKTTTALLSQPDAALANILDRLQRLEAQPTTAVNPFTPPYSEPSNVVTRASTSSSTTPTPDLHEPNVSGPGRDIDAISLLKNAVDQVHNIRLRGLASSIITEKISIPPDLAKLWIQNYFTHISCCMFISLIDRRVIEFIPDILGLPHIHIEPAVLLVYHCILYYGCLLPESNQSSPTSVSYSSACYISCLRAIPVWQATATSTMTNFVAALFMTGVAHQHFDEDLAWRMFKVACEYCHALNLHNMDSNMSWEIDGKRYRDDDRKGLWEALQYELFFRLMLNKPPVLTGTAWRVNLPWLEANSQLPTDDIDAIIFLSSSRCTLVVIRFFDLLEENNERINDDITAKTDELCLEIPQIFAEWQLQEWMKNPGNKPVNYFEVADVLLFGYSSIFYMYRKLELLSSNSPEAATMNQDIPDCPLIIDASRQIVEIMGQLLIKVPFVETMVTFFGTYRCYLAIGCLAKAILQASDISRHMENIKSLARLGNQAELLARGREDVMPLVQAMQNLNIEIQRKLSLSGFSNGPLIDEQ